mgnify:FL=1
MGMIFGRGQVEITQSILPRQCKEVYVDVSVPETGKCYLKTFLSSTPGYGADLAGNDPGV